MTETIFVGGKTYIVTRPEGSNADVSLYGTYASGGSDDKGLMISQFTPTMKNNLIRNYTLGGGRSYRSVVPGKSEVSATMEWEVQHGGFFKYVLGSTGAATNATKTFDAVAITAPTSALKCYSILEDDIIDSFTLDESILSEEETTDVVNRYYGCKINSLSLKADTENPLHASADIIAQKTLTTLGTASAPTRANLADVPFMFYKGLVAMGTGDYGTGTGTASTLTDATKTWTTSQWITNYVVIDAVGTAFAISANDATTLTVSGTPATGEYTITPKASYASTQVVSCNSMDITMSQNLEPFVTINNATGRGPKYAIEKQREYSLKLDMNFVNTDQLGRFYNGVVISSTGTQTTDAYTPFTIVLDYANSPLLGDSYKALRLVFNDVSFDEESLPVNPKDMLKEGITAFAKKCTGYMITSDSI